MGVKNLIRRCLLAGLTLSFVPSAAIAADDQPFDTLLSRYVVVSPDGVNRVRYRAWAANTADRGALDAYVAALEREVPSRMARNEAFAYWANLYNAVTLQTVLENYPIRSIRDVRSRTLDPRGLIGPWRTERVRVEGRRLTLDAIEHDILRPTFGDPRVHYAVNCASIGCPNLPTRAWRAATLDQDLDAAARAYVNHRRGARFDANGRLEVSSIYNWFARDFGGSPNGVLAHLRTYAAPALSERLRSTRVVAGHSYDWSLNDVN
ncbi:MAG: DUF547 domain-containing protein [Caulobacteraceae bacterium]